MKSPGEHDRSDKTEILTLRAKEEPVIKSYGLHLDLAHCRSHQRASSWGLIMPTVTSAFNEGYNEGYDEVAYVIHRQHTG